eukprot:915583-Rhodomonas_salina.1
MAALSVGCCGSWSCVAVVHGLLRQVVSWNGVAVFHGLLRPCFAEWRSSVSRNGTRAAFHGMGTAFHGMTCAHDDGRHLSQHPPYNLLIRHLSTARVIAPYDSAVPHIS